MKRSTGWFLGSAGTRALVLAAIISASAALSVAAATWSAAPYNPPRPPKTDCPVGYQFADGECVIVALPITCPDAYHLEADSCVPDIIPTCGEGYLYSEGRCVLQESPKPDPIPKPTPNPQPQPHPDPDPTPEAIPYGNLHGVNFIDRILARNEGGHKISVQTGYVDEFVAKANQSGFNVFRIPVTWEGYVDNKANFLEELDYLVKTANEHGIYVWIGFFHYEATSHWPYKVSPFAGGFPKFVVSCYHPTKDYELDPEVRAFWDDYYLNKVRDSSNSCKRTLDVWSLQADFMKDIINEVDKYPNVIGYELINEPHVWKDSHYAQLGDLHTALAKELRKSTDKVLIFTRETAHGLKPDGTKYERKADLEYKILPKDPAKNVMYAPHIYNLNEIKKQVSLWKEVQKKWASMGYDVEIAVGEWAPQSLELKSPAVTQQNVDQFVSAWSGEGWMHTYWAYGGFVFGEGNVLVKYNGKLTNAGEYLLNSINKYYDDGD